MERARTSPPADSAPDVDHDALSLRPPGPPDAPEETVDPDQAERVWRVAARLQADAARRLDARSRELADEQAPPDRPATAFTRGEVDEIARAAGIDPSFVALAWREVEAGRHQPPVSDDRQRRASAFLGTDAERLAVTRVFRATPDAVLASMQRVLPADPFRLSLIDVIGDAPDDGSDLTDTALLFDVPQVTVQAAQTGGYTPFSYAMSVSDLTRAVVTLHDLGDGRTEATVAVDLRHGKGRNLTVGSWVTGAVAASLGFVGGMIGFAAGDGGLAAALGATIGASGSGTLSYLAYSAAYRRGLSKGERALGDLLSAVEVDIRSGGAFRVPPPSPRGPRSNSWVNGV